MPIIALLIFTFSTAVIGLFIPIRYGNRFAAISSLLVFFYSLYLFITFPISADYQYVVDFTWIQPLGIHFKVGLDGISILMLMLTTFLTPLIIFSVRKSEPRPRAFYSLLLFMEMALIGVFVSMDGFLFYIFWEIALIPIYFICLLWGGKDRVRITLKFFIYTLAGSLFMLVALIYLYLHTPVQHSFDIQALYAAGKSLSGGEQSVLFWFFFLAFGIKMPLFPLHTWQPDTYTDAPTQGTMMLSGIMLKMGIYGLIRWMIPMLPQGLAQNAEYVMWLAVAGVIYAGIIAFTQKDMKRLLAYSSISHVGLIAAGIFAFNAQGLQGGIIQMLSHGVNVVGLFFIVDIIQSRTGTRDIGSLGGIRLKAPNLATIFAIIMLGAVALPLTDGFPGEFLLISGVFKFENIAGAVAGLTIIIGAVYMLRMYQRSILGETSVETDKFTDLTTGEIAVLIPIVIMVILIGVCPNLFLKVSEPAVMKLLSGI
jgi:NADH-quinone oxidoreductase subunit M